MTEEANAQNQPTIGVGAVVFRGDDVLLVRRDKAPLKGCWSIPGGRLEFGEPLADAVRREVREETGLDIEILGLVNVFEALPDGPPGLGGHMVLIDFVATSQSGEPVAGDDAAEAEFVPFEEARRRLGWDETRRALDQAAAFRERLCSGASKGL